MPVNIKTEEKNHVSFRKQNLFILSENIRREKTIGGYARGWNDITTMDLKGLESYVSSGFM
jgi:hypothetical protein